MCQGRFGFNIWINFSEKVVRHRDRVHREVVQSLFPRVFKKHVDVALRDTGSGHG